MSDVSGAGKEPARKAPPAAPPPANPAPLAAPPPANPAPLAAPPPPQPAAATPKGREIRPLPVTRYTLINDSGGTFGRVWGATIPTGVPWEHVLADEFWAHKANVFFPYDTVLLKHDNREYYARLLVLETRTVGNSVEKNRVTMHVLEKHDLKPADSNLDSYRALYEISHLGAERKWCVIEVQTRTIVHEGFATVDDAQIARRMAAAQVAQREAAQRRAGR